jgi:hypothetical protein
MHDKLFEVALTLRPETSQQEFYSNYLLLCAARLPSSDSYTKLKQTLIDQAGNHKSMKALDVARALRALAHQHDFSDISEWHRLVASSSLANASPSELI